MGWVKRLVTVVLAITVFVWGVLFSAENTTEVTLNLVFVELPNARVSLWIVGSFVVGGLLGLVFSLLLIGRLKIRTVRLKRQLAKSHEQLARTHNGVLKDLS